MKRITIALFLTYLSCNAFAAVAPATVIDSNSSLSSGKYDALTVDGFSGSNITVMNRFIANGRTTLLNSTVKGTSQVNGDLNSNNSTFKQTSTVQGNLLANNSYFGQDLSFAGSSAKLVKTKVIGNLVSSNESGITTITLDHSTVKGSISFCKPGGIVIMQKSKLVGSISNGSLQQH